MIRAKEILRSIFLDGMKINKTLFLINTGAVGLALRMVMRRSAAATHRSAPPPPPLLSRAPTLLIAKHASLKKLVGRKRGKKRRGSTKYGPELLTLSKFIKLFFLFFVCLPYIFLFRFGIFASDCDSTIRQLLL